MTRARQTLAQVPLFRSVKPADMQVLESHCAWQQIPAKQWVIDFQDTSADVFFVVAGTVRVLIYTPAGREVILAEIPAGGFFGELAAIDGNPRSATVLALTDTIMASMPGAAFLKALHDHPDVCLQVLRRLAAQIRALDTRVYEYSSLDVRRRIYSELLRLGQPAAKQPGRAIISPPPIHADIAARVSTHREAVSRELKSLERAGLLERRRGALVLTDVPGLMARVKRTRKSGESGAPRREGRRSPDSH